MSNNYTGADFAAGAVQMASAEVAAGVHQQVVQVADATGVVVPPGGPDGTIGAGSVTAAGTIFSIDTTGYASIAVQVTNAGVGSTVSYEASNDNATWIAVAGMSVATSGSTPVASSSTAAGILAFPCQAKWFRARVTAYGSGTVAATYALRKTPINVTVSPWSAGVGAGVTVSSLSVNAPGIARIASAATTNATSVKAGSGVLTDIFAANTSAAVRYLKLYNKASAPIVGIDTPIMTLPIPAGGSIAPRIGFALGFSSGIAYAITGGIADNDATAVAANDVHGFLGFK